MMLPFQDPITSAGMAGRMTRAAAISPPHFVPAWPWHRAALSSMDGQRAENQAGRLFAVHILHVEALGGPAEEPQPISVEPGR